MKKLLVFLLCIVTLLTGVTTGCKRNMLTTEEASSIVKDANDRYVEIFGYFISPILEMSVDKTKTLPDDPDMWLVTDERFPNIKAIHDFLRAVLTDEFINTHHSSAFNEVYLSPAEAEIKGLNHWDYKTVYYEYQGRLYVNQDPPTPHEFLNLTITDWDNPNIVSQSAKKMVVEYPLLLPQSLEDDTDSYELYGSITYTVKKENNTWLLDGITETQLK